jgi:hypothetical protein
VFSACNGQVLPTIEVCNDRDDDCDGNVDEISDASCATGLIGECARGMFQCGSSGRECVQMVDPVVESCNGLDDDCDGETDEGAGSLCYPDAVPGCATVDGQLICTGLCRPGEQRCTGDGGTCVGATVPQAEVCTAPGDIAFDEDCDGEVDEGCDCTSGDSQMCYRGPPMTLGDVCTAGSQICSASAWGTCEGDRLPMPETCDPASAGVDDDCDGEVDNVIGVGDTCSDPKAMGVCRAGTLGCVDGARACVTPDPSSEICDDLDNDCDATTDEDFDKRIDPLNCGTCGTECMGDCCNGGCTDRRSDEVNCGACGTVCSGGQACCAGECSAPDSARCAGCTEDCATTGETCCTGSCVDTAVDELNCGGCGRACGDGQVCCAGACVGSDATHCGQGCEVCGDNSLCCERGCVEQNAAHCLTCTDDCRAMGGTCCAESDGCVNLSSDPVNCGACGRTCEPGDVCSEGICCPSGHTACGGVCVNLQSNNNNCGICGRTCLASGIGVCSCVAGACNGICL